MFADPELPVRAADARRAAFVICHVIASPFSLPLSTLDQQADRSVTITAKLSGLSVGRAGVPVRGSGIFVSGAGDSGSRLSVSQLETGAVYSDGGIAPGTPDRNHRRRIC